MAYEGGYTSALDSASQRDSQQAYVRQVAQALAQQQWRQKQLEEEQRKDEQAGMNAVRTYKDGGLYPPQAAPPGQASQPMMMPPPPPPPPPPGMGGSAASMMGPAMQPPPGMGAAAMQPQPPQGWQASPAAPPQLGGGPKPPMQAGAGPQAPPPAGAPPPPPAAAIAAQGAGAAPGIAPPGAPDQQHNQLPPQWLSIPNAIAAMDKANVPLDQQYRTLEKMYPMIEGQNKQALEKLKIEVDDARAVTQLLQQRRLLRQTEAGPQDTAHMRNIKFDEARGGGAGGGAAGAPAKAVGASYDSLPPAQQKVVDFYATLQLGGDSTWRTGLARIAEGARLIKSVDERVPSMADDLNLTAADVGTNKAKRVASQAALTQITKDLTAIEPFSKMLDQNIDILKGLATKVIKSDSALANRPINWIQQNVGDNPDYAEFVTQLRLVQTEAARVITNPRLVGQLTDSARGEIEELASGTLPLNATNRVLDRLHNDSERRVGEMKKKQSSLEDSIKSLSGGGKTPAKAGELTDKEMGMDVAPLTPAQLKVTGGYVETRKTADGRTLGKKPDGTIEEVK